MHRTLARTLSILGVAATGILAACGGSSGTGSSGTPSGKTTATFMGGDGIVDTEFFTEAGASGNGALGTIAAPDPTKVTTAAKFLSDYKAKFNTDPGAYSANGYDAMNILLLAAQQAIADNGGKLPAATAFREAVRTKVAAISYDGAIGHTQFDSNGDTTNALLTLFKGVNQAWAFDQTLTVKVPGQSVPSVAAMTPNSSKLTACTGTVGVATDLPVSGSDASDGVPAQNGAQMAVDQANASKMFGGCTVKFTPKDDASVALGKHDPAQGAANLTGLVGDASIIGVVGPFNSNVALTELPIANKGNLVQISPSNTNPGLTIVGSNPDIDTASLRPTGKITYFRVCTTDIGQGKADADAAYKLGLRKAYVIDDQETYGKGLADQFVKDFQADGGKVLGRASLPGTTTDYRAQITQAKGLGVDLVYFGGTSSNGGGIVRKQMVEQGLGTAGS